MNTNIKNTILLIVRILVGGTIAFAGVVKLSNMETTVAMLGGMTGLSSGYIWAVALGELLSGLGIIFGVWTKLASLGTAIIMIGAVYYTGGKDVTAISLLVGSIVLIFTGGGKWSLVTWKSKNVAIVAPDTTDLPKF